MADKFYVICTTPRSGSNLLCDLLESSGIMGQPKEFLNLDSVILPFARQNNLMESESKIYLDTYLDSVVKKFSSKNNVFAMKLLFDQFEPYMELNVIRKFIHKFKFIWLLRKDVLSQAVSMHIAKETDEWTSFNEKQNKEKENKNRREFVEYDESKIDRFLRKLAKDNLNWIEFFSINQLDYLPVTYEDVLSNTNQVCHSICNFCGVETNYQFSLKQATFKKQGDDLNERFRDAFRKSSSLNLARQTQAHEIQLRGTKLVEPKIIENTK